ncbi:MAG: CIA30 family protein [Planctomycetota bacterium]
MPTNLTLILAFLAHALGGEHQVTGERMITDFEGPKVPIEWIIMNDNVMGGRSIGGPVFAGGVLTFSGSTNTNGGGFSSTRTIANDWDLSDFDAIRLRVRGDGRTYLAEIRTGVTLRGRAVAYRASFKTSDSGAWEEIDVPFERFTPSVWGQDVSRWVEPLDTSSVRTFGFMIYDGLDGAFKLEADWVKAVVIEEESRGTVDA